MKFVNASERRDLHLRGINARVVRPGARARRRRDQQTLAEDVSCVVWFCSCSRSSPLPATASATWSVIAVDRSTGRVVIASATCVDRDDQFLMGVQAVVVPGNGRGGVPGRRRQHAPEPDAGVSRAAERHRSEGDHRAAERRSRVPDAPVRHRRSAGTQRRSLGPRPTATSRRTFTARCRAPRSSIRFRATSCGPGTVVPNAVQAFLHAKGAITDRVMAAMEAADGSGGDSRCTCPPWPTDGSKPAIPCVGEDRARRLHPDGGEGRHQRRLAQQRQVHDVSHRVAAGAGSRAERDPAKART